MRASLLAFASATAVGAPLDDQIAAFAKARPQDAAGVQRVLDAGLAEGRSAQAYAAVAGWLDANAVSAQPLLFAAARSAEYAGEWSVAASLYRQLLENPQVDPGLAAEATPALYRLLIDPLAQPDVAYLFMREHGDRLRAFGANRRFDDWFLTLAKAKNDPPAVLNRLAAICGADPAGVALYAADLDWAYGQLESPAIPNEATLAAAAKLAAAAHLPVPSKARINWVLAVVPCTIEATALFRANKPIPDALFDKPLQAAEALVAALPFEGSILVARGWMNFREGHTPNFLNYLAPRREAKAAPILKALASLPPQQAQAVLSAPGDPQGRPVSMLFSPTECRALVGRVPAVMNSLVTPYVPLFEKTLTVDEAKALAPQLARNPHGEAALIRAIAAAGSTEFSAIAAALPPELWRWADPKAAVDAAWGASATQAKKMEEVLPQIVKPDPRADEIAKQIDKAAPTQARMAAFQALAQDLLGPAPTIRNALVLWDQLFANAPAADAIPMLVTMLGNLEGDRDVLLRRALNVAQAGGHALYVGPDTDGFMHNGPQRDGYRAAVAPLVPKVQEILAAQAQQGRLSEPLFGLWLHAVNPQDPAVQAFMQQLVATPAYANLPSAYRAVAARSGGPDPRFGLLALPPALQAGDPFFVSQPLLTLPADAPPEAVEAALKAAVERAGAAPRPVAVVGLQRVATLPVWSPQVRGLAFTLFKQNAPLGGYPPGQGYQQVVQRAAKEYADAKAWQAIEPYAAGLWQAAAYDGGQNQAAAALTGLSETALAAGQPSAALALARAGIRGPVGKWLATTNDPFHTPLLGRLRQVSSKAGLAIGAAEIPVDETDPAYPIWKSNAEFASGNLEAAWSLYAAHADQLRPVLRKLPVDYAFWLLERSVAAERVAESESLIKELLLWAKEAPGLLNPEQDARLKIAYADVQFLRGALATARAWYRKVADSADFRNTEMHLLSGLGAARVDRVTKNFSAALTELDKLVALGNPAFGQRIRFARAEVLMEQENFKEALDEIAAVLRQEPKHPDALLLQGRIHTEMRKLIEASEIELGPSQTDTVLVPGEAVKVNLRDPTLGISGVAAEIEVEVKAKSGDSELVLLAPLGDSRDKFRAEVPTMLGPPTPGDKKLQVIGGDEIRFGYSPRFRAKMRELPPDPDTVIGVAADARLGISAGGFPPLDGERRLSVEELGLSTAQAKLGFRAVRPGNPVYLRVIDPDQSTTGGPDTVVVSLAASSGDEIPSLALTETAPFSGVFEAVVPTAASQALAFASENAPGRDAAMAISPGNHPGWQGKPGDKEAQRIFGVDLNDDVALGTMTIQPIAGQAPTHFVLQTSQNGRDWVTRSRYRGAADPAPCDGRPQVTSFSTDGHSPLPIAAPKDRELPAEWREKMDLVAMRGSVNFLAATVPNLSAQMPVVNLAHFQNSRLLRFRAVFHQPTAAIRRFQVTGWPAADDKGVPQTIFLIDGQPAAKDAADPLTIHRELAPGLHTIEVWWHGSRDALAKATPALLCDVEGKQELVPCPDAMFDPATFPEGVRAEIPLPATITAGPGGIEVAFAKGSHARLVRLVIFGTEGVAPGIAKVALIDAAGARRLPVAEDAVALRKNSQLEVLPGDSVTARYVDPVSATPGRTRHEDRLTVAYNTATLTASFLNYEQTAEGRVLVLEPIRRFGYGAAVGIVIDDADMDATQEPDVVEFRVKTGDGVTATMKAVETEKHSGRFLGRVFPVEGKPARESEIQVTPGGSLTATYRDRENLDPGVPADRSVTIVHARYAAPAISGYTVSSEALPEGKAEPAAPQPVAATRGRGTAAFVPRQNLAYAYVGEPKVTAGPLDGVIGAPVRFDVVVPHLAFAQSSTIAGYVQTEAARQASKDATSKDKDNGAKDVTAKGTSAFDINLPGTLKLIGTLERPAVAAPPGYTLTAAPQPPTSRPPLDEGRFAFTVPLILGDLPERSFADKAAEALPIPQGLAVKAGDIVHVGFAWEDAAQQIQWKTASFTVGSHAFLDVLSGDASRPLTAAYLGEKIVVRLLAPGLDRGPERDLAEVAVAAGGGATAALRLSETEPHSGLFTGAFTTVFADKPGPVEVASVEIEGLPVRYGEEVTVSYEGQSHRVGVNKGADGAIEPFTKRYGGDEVAVRTAFTLAECFLELAKKHVESNEESLARREIDHAEKLLGEALATHRDESLKAQAEYLLGNLAQEYADLAKNDESKRPRYQQALKRFAEIPLDYPDTEFASKAQYKTAQTYEKLGEAESAVEEYVKLAYKYPGDELIPAVMSKLGDYFQKKGQALKDEADPLRENKDDASKAEVLRLDERSYPEFLKAARVFEKLRERFPDDPLAALAGIRAGQNYMRAHQYDRAAKAFEPLIDNESYDGPSIRAQAMYWSAYSREVSPNSDHEGAYKLYQRIKFDFPESIWAKRARGRLADPAFASIIKQDQLVRQQMINALKEQQKNP
jgi:outer membrane protein assembly factor BamD (BamD/ComL family)